MNVTLSTDSKYLGHLLPEQSVFFQNPVSTQYHTAVAALLLDSVNAKRLVVCGVVCLPSFEREWAVRLLQERKQQTFCILLTQAGQPIWPPSPTELYNVTNHEAEIPGDDAQAISDVWKKMLFETRHASECPLGLDGETFHFFCQGGMEGKTWSPKQNTAPGKLASISLLLREYALATGSSRSVFSQKIRTEIAWFRSVI